MKTVGVFFVPFQTVTIPQPHRDTLEQMFKNFNAVVIALKVRRVTPTKNAPLDFSAREEMIRAYLGPKQKPVFIVPVVDKKYPHDQVAALDNAVTALFSEGRKLYLFTDSDFVNLYKENGGKMTISPGTAQMFSMFEEGERMSHVDAPVSLSSEEFRRGLVYGMNSQFPISWPTIDMAIRRVVLVNREAPPHGEIRYLFGKKPGEKGWRFPGGFKDREDPNFEAAVWREGSEEVLKKGVEPQNVFTFPRYITSRNVGDWRYRGEKDGITTLFYQVTFTGTEDQIMAGDDLCDSAWLTLDEVRKQGIEGEHIYLLDSLEGFEAMNAEPKRCEVCNTLLTCDCGIPPTPRNLWTIASSTILSPYKQVYMEDCHCCGGTGKIRSAFQMGVDTHCDVCCGVSKKDAQK